MRCFADTNILIYPLDQNDRSKADAATAIVSQLAARRSLVVSMQVLNEMTNTLLRKRPDLTISEIRSAVGKLRAFGDDALTWETVDIGWRIRALTGYRWWDSLLVANAYLKGCRYFLSEDMQHERTIFDVTILNPFLTSPLDLPISN